MRGNTTKIKLVKGVLNRAFNPLYQYDYGQKLVFEETELPMAYEVHFSNSECEESKVCIGNSEGVAIPDEYLLTGEPVYIWVFLHDGEQDGETEYRGMIPVLARAEATDIPVTPVEQDVITQTIAALNEAVEKSETNVEHYPQVRDGYWYVWDANTDDFVNTNVKAEGVDGENGAVYVPSVSQEGVISWTNDGGLPNPEPVDFISIVEEKGYAKESEIPTKVSDLIDDSGHYTKPDGGIPINDLSDDVLATLENKIDDGEKGAPYGVAELDETGKVPSSQLPSYVDDIIEYPTRNDFPDPGESGKLYVDQSSNEIFRWSGSMYVSVSEAGADHAPKHNPVFTGSMSMGRKFNTIVGGASTAFGIETEASGVYSHAEGNGTKATANSAHAEGQATKALATGAHAEGYNTQANGNYAHSEGAGVTANGAISHAEGESTTASGTSAHAEGYSTIASGAKAHTEGTRTAASGDSSHAEGIGSTASSNYSHAEGYYTTATGYQSHTEGYQTQANNGSAHAEGYGTVSSGMASHSEGRGTVASGYYSHAEGEGAKALGVSAHAEGYRDVESRTVDGVTYFYGAYGNYSHSEGINTSASGDGSHSEGGATVAGGYQSHAEGSGTDAIGAYAHSEGGGTHAIGNGAHAEGGGSTASGGNSHAEGGGSTASGDSSHAEGGSTTASGMLSHAEGANTIAAGTASHVVGMFNVEDTYAGWDEWVAGTSYEVGDRVKITNASTNNVYTYICKTANSDATFDSSKWQQRSLYGMMNYAEIVGNGIGHESRSNARALDWEGNEYLMGDIYVNCNPDGTGGTKLTSPVIPEFGSDPQTYQTVCNMTFQEVYDAIESGKCSACIINGTMVGDGILSLSLLTANVDCIIFNAEMAATNENDEVSLQNGLMTIALTLNADETVGVYTNGFSLVNSIAKPYEDLTFPITAGTLCLHMGTLYKAKQDISSYEDFYYTHWQRTTLADELANGGGGTVTDVQVNGTSVLNGGVANIPIASSSAPGVAKVFSGDTAYGIHITNGGVLEINCASDTNIKAGNQSYKPLVTSKQHQAVYYGLAKAAGADLASETVTVGTYPATAQSAIQSMIGINVATISETEAIINEYEVIV